jgi:hypothetical protein
MQLSSVYDCRNLKYVGYAYILNSWASTFTPSVAKGSIQILMDAISALCRGAIMLEPITWLPNSPDLTPLDFFLWGYMQSLVYETPAETRHDLVARIAVAGGTIREMPGIFQRVQHNIARRCRTCNI